MDRERQLILFYPKRHPQEVGAPDIQALLAHLARGHGAVYLPDAMARRYPNAHKEWIWPYVFPTSRLSVDPRSGAVRRCHLDESGLQKAIRQAARQAGRPLPAGRVSREGGNDAGVPCKMGRQDKAVAKKARNRSWIGAPII